MTWREEWCRKCSRFARCRLGAEADAPPQAREERNGRGWEMSTKNLQKRRMMISSREKRERTERRWEKKQEPLRKECNGLRGEFEVGGFMALKTVREHRQKVNV